MPVEKTQLGEGIFEFKRTTPSRTHFAEQAQATFPLQRVITEAKKGIQIDIAHSPTGEIIPKSENATSWTSIFEGNINGKFAFLAYDHTPSGEQTRVPSVAEWGAIVSYAMPQIGTGLGAREFATKMMSVYPTVATHGQLKANAEKMISEAEKVLQKLKQTA